MHQRSHQTRRAADKDVRRMALIVRDSLNNATFARHSRESGNPVPLLSMAARCWIPAFAGMTAVIQRRRSFKYEPHPRASKPTGPGARGQGCPPSGTDRPGFSEQRSVGPSFPRKRKPGAFAFHGRTSLDPRLRGDDSSYSDLLDHPDTPAIHQTRRAADQDVRRLALIVWDPLNNAASARHSRESGNPVPLLSMAARRWIPAFAGMTAVIQRRRLLK